MISLCPGTNPIKEKKWRISYLFNIFINCQHHTCTPFQQGTFPVCCSYLTDLRQELLMKLSSASPCLYKGSEEAEHAPPSQGKHTAGAQAGVAPSTIFTSGRMDFSSVHHSSLSTQPRIWHRMDTEQEFVKKPSIPTSTSVLLTNKKILHFLALQSSNIMAQISAQKVFWGLEGVNLT